LCGLQHSGLRARTTAREDSVSIFDLAMVQLSSVERSAPSRCRCHASLSPVSMPSCSQDGMSR
jgi:hypothetical protein